jgi:Uma2 family endonuclease
MATVLTPADQRVVLSNVSWQTYEALLADLADSSAPRLTFDQGTLEIMSPTAEHEEINRTIALLVEIAAEELEIDVRSLGSTTFKREDLARGFEPDSCFYVRNTELVRGKARIDLSVDPPPDLVIEIDITSPSLNKLAIFAKLGVSEVWRYDGEKLHMGRLEKGEYVACQESLAFPALSAGALTDFIQKSRTSKRPDLLRAFRSWLRQRAET